MTSNLDILLAQVKSRLEKAERRYVCDDFSGELSEKYAERGMKELMRYAPTDLARLLAIVERMQFALKCYANDTPTDELNDGTVADDCLLDVEDLCK